MALLCASYLGYKEKQDFPFLFNALKRDLKVTSPSKCEVQARQLSSVQGN